MVALPTIEMSSNGGVVIPETIRRRLGLAKGSRFVVMGHGDTVMLKTLQPPARAAIGELLDESRRAAKRAGVKRSDVAKAIKRVRATTRKAKRA